MGHVSVAYFLLCKVHSFFVVKIVMPLVIHGLDFLFSRFFFILIGTYMSEN